MLEECCSGEGTSFGIKRKGSIESRKVSHGEAAEMKLNLIFALVFLLGALASGVGIVGMIVGAEGVKSFCPSLVVG